MTVELFLFFTKMKEKGFTLLKARLQDLLTSLKTSFVFKKPTGKSKCKIRPDGSKCWYLNGELHCEDGPAIEWPDGVKYWYLNGKEAHPETLVDLHLSRGTFCYYNEETETLHFDEIK